MAMNTPEDLDATLVSEYEQAFVEWCEAEDSQLWESTVGDGLGPLPTES